MLAVQAETEGWYGRLKNARELIGRAMDSARHNDAKETAAVYQSYVAGLEVELGYPAQARADTDAALKLAPNFAVQVYVARVLAQAGDIARAEKLVAELDKTLPLSAVLQRDGLLSGPGGHRLVPQRPSARRRTTKVGEHDRLFCNLFPGRSLSHVERQQRGGSGISENSSTTTAWWGMIGWGALARLGLARAYAIDAAKDPVARDKARAAYQSFLTLWKDADPDIPVYKQAKAEYAKLSNRVQ